jgi:prevent-host-death family protein
MQIANIASAKNQFSRLIEQVRQGETIVITDRNRPVAQLRPLDNADSSLAALHASGLLSPPDHALDLDAFLAAPRATLAANASLRAAILEEREEGR